MPKAVGLSAGLNDIGAIGNAVEQRLAEPGASPGLEPPEPQLVTTSRSPSPASASPAPDRTGCSARVTPGPSPTLTLTGPVRQVGVTAAATKFMDGKTGKPTEWNGQKWSFYSDLERFPINEQPQTMRGKNYQLSHWYRTYDWDADQGYANFQKWIE
jgi:hypothetical protein